MNLDEYEAEAMRTSGTDFSFVSIDGKNRALILAALGMGGEAREFIDEIKKVAYHAKLLDEEHAVKELGDVLWYVALAAHALGVPLSRVAEINVEKLKRQYPSGFTSHAARGDRA